MSDQEQDDSRIPVLKDVVVPVSQTTVATTDTDAHSDVHSGAQSDTQIAAVSSPTLLSSTLQAEVDAIIEKARADFDATIAQALSEMQQHIERELSELHVQLTSDN